MKDLKNLAFILQDTKIVTSTFNTRHKAVLSIRYDNKILKNNKNKGLFL